MLLVLVLSAIFALLCVSAPMAGAAERQGSSSVPAPLSMPVKASLSTTDEYLEAGAPQHADRDPCEESPDHHHCDRPGQHGVLGHPPLVGADRAPAPGQPATPETHGALDPSREPGAARPPDLHQLQLLRV